MTTHDTGDATICTAKEAVGTKVGYASLTKFTNGQKVQILLQSLY